MTGKRAVVLLSGGLDSATCLYLAVERGYRPIALSFDYGQRHRNELVAAARIAGTLNVQHRIIAVDLKAIGGSALTADLAVPKGGAHLTEKAQVPVTYVPVRNLIFLSLAFALAEAEHASAIFIGVNAIDYSGYPDCRPDFLEAFAKAATLASKIGREGAAPQIVAPLVTYSKAAIAREAIRLKVPVSQTWSCYDPQILGNLYTPCENCDACILRRDGFRATSVPLTNEEVFGSPIRIS